jgi:hypothetical protein
VWTRAKTGDAARARAPFIADAGPHEVDRLEPLRQPCERDRPVVLEEISAQREMDQRRERGDHVDDLGG